MKECGLTYAKPLNVKIVGGIDATANSLVS